VYATLANASVRYEAGHSFGATVSPARSFAAGLAVQAATDPVSIVADADQEVQAGRVWDRRPPTPQTWPSGAAPRTPRWRRPTDIDHGNDEIWFLLRPAVSLTPRRRGNPRRCSGDSLPARGRR
jgi:hypothetical protein